MRNKVQYLCGLQEILCCNWYTYYVYQITPYILEEDAND